MRNYRSKATEFMREGFTHLFIVELADLSVGFSNQQILLTNLGPGDTVLDGLIDVKTTVAGPTGAPTGQIKINTLNNAITTTCVLNSATVVGAVPNNSVLMRSMVQTGTDTLVLDLQAGGGNGAAATAGEIWCWVCLSRQVERTGTQA